MAEGKWTPGKVILVVFLVLVVLGVLCCGGGYLLVGDKIRAVMHATADFAAFRTDCATALGPGAAVSVGKDDRRRVGLLVGVPGDLTADRVRELQDKTWKVYADAFRQRGSAVPVAFVAVGKPVAGESPGHEDVVEWGKNLIAVEELVQRTGVAAPPRNAEITRAFGEKTRVEITDGNISVTTGTQAGEAKPEEKPPEKPEEKSDGKKQEPDGGRPGAK